MNKELIKALENMLDLSMSLGSECTCRAGYVCRICQARLTLDKARELDGKEGIRPRKKIKCTTTGKEFNTLSEAGEFYGVVSATISKCLKGQLKVAGVFEGTKLEWEYVN